MGGDFGGVREAGGGIGWWEVPEVKVIIVGGGGWGCGEGGGAEKGMR